MFAVKLRKASFWISVVTAGVIPFVLFAFKLLYPPVEAKLDLSAEGFASFAVNILGGMVDGIVVMLWTAAFAAAAFVSSLVAFTAAWVAHESRRTKILCLLPALLVVIALGVLITLGA